MGITDKEFEMLLHDLKRIGKAIEIISDEENKDKRKLIADLLRAELDRLYKDVEDVRKENNNEKS